MATSSKFPARKAGAKQIKTPQGKLASSTPRGASSSETITISRELFNKIEELVNAGMPYYSHPSTIPLTEDAKANCLHILLHYVHKIETSPEWAAVCLKIALKNQVEFSSSNSLA